MIDAQAMQYPRITKTRRIMDLNGLWKFKFDPDGIGIEKNWINGLEDTIAMPVPASFNDFFTDKVSREYTGDFWYEKEFIVPGEWKGMETALRFECATHRATVYVNGKEITSHEGGFLPFLARIGDVVKFNEVNKVVVKLNN